MCDVNGAGFFRPWKSEVIDRTMSHDKTMINRETEIRTVEKCVEERRESDEEHETDSVDSSWSAASDMECYRRRSDSRRRSKREHGSRRRRSLGSSCSTVSYDDPSATGSPCNFAGYDIGGKSSEENCRAKAEAPSSNDLCRNGNNSNSSSEISSSVSCDSPTSAFTSIPYGVAYPNLDYPSPLLMDSIVPNWPPSHAEQMNLFYGLASMPIRNYGSCMEEAVKYIHQQDVAAKQMKKLRPKKFRCHHCDVAFSNNGQLKGHIRIHTGERPFKCEIDGCNKAFTRNEELTRHRKIHTGLKPHSCDMCGKSFGRKDHLKKHQRTHQNRGIPAHFGAAMFGFIEHVGHYQSLPPGHPLPPYHYPVSG